MQASSGWNFNICLIFQGGWSVQSSAVFVFPGDHFPLEARHHLAPWIDQNFTADLDLGNPQHEEHAQRLAMELVGQLESKAGAWLVSRDRRFPPEIFSGREVCN